MKKIFVLLFLSIFAIFTNSWLCEASSSPDPVLDINGKILRTEKTYFIVPVNGEKYGGVAVENMGNNETCQLNVIPKRYVEPHGHGLELIPVDKKKGVIRVSTDLNIAIYSTYDCLHSTMWHLEKYDGRRYFINVGPKSRRNWFKIEKYGRGYKFVYCKVICKDVGVVMVNGQRRLGLNDVPLVFNFKKEILEGR
ncbi:miraculin-like [Solanum dulcamara]|uniref:miraculin-like n=1 Tax=Solanum dulcamara TaxID=45834 RepID=UPI00248662AC|nr:miraculin-like [Solanum dulcamara]